MRNDKKELKRDNIEIQRDYSLYIWVYICYSFWNIREYCEQLCAYKMDPLEEISASLEKFKLSSSSLWNKLLFCHPYFYSWYQHSINQASSKPSSHPGQPPAFPLHMKSVFTSSQPLFWTHAPPYPMPVPPSKFFTSKPENLQGSLVDFPRPFPVMHM